MPFAAEEFAKLMARFDTGNPSEAEAISAARVMRRIVASEGLRFVDVMERADVKKALDAQLQPVREDSAELKEAFGKIAELADALARERCPASASNAAASPGDSCGSLVNGWLEAVTAALAVALMIAAALE